MAVLLSCDCRRPQELSNGSDCESGDVLITKDSGEAWRRYREVRSQPLSQDTEDDIVSGADVILGVRPERPFPGSVDT